MKKQYLTAAALAIFLTANAENKFDAKGEIIAGQYLQFIKDPAKPLMLVDNIPFSTDIASRSEATASVAIILADGATASQIEDLGFSISAATKSVVVAEGPMSAIIDLADSDLVKSVSFVENFDQLLDYARQFTGVSTIHEGGDGLPQAYTGKGVITGIFDSGFYPDHYNFKDEDGVCRITNFWNYTKSDGSAVTHYDSPEKVVTINQGTDNEGTDSNSSSHGTHTLGCMAGYCYPNVKSMIIYDQRTDQKEVINALKYPKGKQVPFYGMAKESEIVAAAGSLTNLNMMGGLQKISEYIHDSGKPGVINLSIGSVIGPKDGSDAFTLFLDEIAESIPVFVAAGNDGDSNCSLTGEAYNTFIATSNSSEAFTGIIDIWGSDSQSFDVSAVVYDTDENKVLFTCPLGLSKGNTILGTSNYSNVTVTSEYFEDAFSSSYIIVNPKKLDTNNRYNLYLQYSLTCNKLTNSDGHLVLGLVVKGNEGQHIDLAHRATKGSGELSSLGVSGWSDGSSDISINSMACGHNTIAVGAWNTRNQWGILPNSIYWYSQTPEIYGLGLDDVAGFSSYGTLCDGRRKPDLSAPGTGIIASVSTPGQKSLDSGTFPCAKYTLSTREDMWGIMQGTSMATPIVAGAVALWLEADPTLTPAEVREIAMSTCTTDQFTASGNPLRWGAGKFNALEGLKKVLGSTGINDITADAGDKLMVTPMGDRCWAVTLNGAKSVNARLINIAGQTVASTSAEGEQATIDASALPTGIYILNVNGQHSSRIAVK